MTFQLDGEQWTGACDGDVQGTTTLVWGETASGWSLTLGIVADEVVLVSFGNHDSPWYEDPSWSYTSDFGSGSMDLELTERAGGWSGTSSGTLHLEDLTTELPSAALTNVRLSSCAITGT